jgi:hypothetical protein
VNRELTAGCVIITCVLAWTGAPPARAQGEDAKPAPAAEKREERKDKRAPPPRSERQKEKRDAGEERPRLDVPVSFPVDI